MRHCFVFDASFLPDASKSEINFGVGKSTQEQESSSQRRLVL
jgi:hypothetical protein